MKWSWKLVFTKKVSLIFRCRLCLRQRYERRKWPKSESKRNLGENWVPLFFSCSLVHSLARDRKRGRGNNTHLSQSDDERYEDEITYSPHVVSGLMSCSLSILERLETEWCKQEPGACSSFSCSFFSFKFFSLSLSFHSKHRYMYSIARENELKLLYFSRGSCTLFIAFKILIQSQLYLQSTQFAHNYRLLVAQLRSPFFLFCFHWWRDKRIIFTLSDLVLSEQGFYERAWRKTTRMKGGTSSCHSLSNPGNRLKANSIIVCTWQDHE